MPLDPLYSREVLRLLFDRDGGSAGELHFWGSQGDPLYSQILHEVLVARSAEIVGFMAE